MKKQNSYTKSGSSTLQSFSDILNKNINAIIDKTNDNIRDIIKNYAEQMMKRIEGKGTISGVEFTGNVKAELKNDWVIAENELNDYANKKLVALINDPTFKYLESMRGKIKDKLDRYNYRSGLGVVFKDPIESKKLKTLRELNVFEFEFPYEIKPEFIDKFPNNKKGYKKFKFGEYGGKFCLILMNDDNWDKNQQSIIVNDVKSIVNKIKPMAILPETIDSDNVSPEKIRDYVINIDTTAQDGKEAYIEGAIANNALYNIWKDLFVAWYTNKYPGEDIKFVEKYSSSVFNNILRSEESRNKYFYVIKNIYEKKWVNGKGGYSMHFKKWIESNWEALTERPKSKESK